jgi:hypothetical protein
MACLGSLPSAPDSQIWSVATSTRCKRGPTTRRSQGPQAAAASSCPHEDSIWRVVDAWSPLPLARQEVRTAGRGAPSRVEGLYHISMSMVWSGRGSGTD